MSLRALRRVADERDVLVGFLDAMRDAVARKMDGVSDAHMRDVGVPSGTSLGGIVKHLADVERWWFQASFAGRALEFIGTDADPDADWRVQADDTLGALLERYRAACDESNRIVAAAASLDEPAAAEWDDAAWGPVPTLRWILVHMIEETARHAGHADILRERLDGRTGW